VDDRRIRWTGNLVEVKPISGYIGKIRVASIAPVDGKLTLVTARGLEPYTEPVKSVKAAKERAEELVEDALFAVGAQYVPAEEQLFLDALRGSANRTEEQDAQVWAQLVAHWEKRHEERQEMIDYLRERLAQRQALFEHEEAARAEA
jgi:hypothetical protein